MWRLEKDVGDNIEAGGFQVDPVEMTYTWRHKSSNMGTKTVWVEVL